MDVKVVRWLLSGMALFAAASWGFTEATLFFLIPDILLTATALFSFRASLLQMAAALAGALAGGALMFGLAAYDAGAVRDVVLQVPFVSEGMFDRVDHDLRTSGVWGMWKGPLSGVPYKIYATVAPRHTGWLLFLVASVPARLGRFLITWILFAMPGAVLQRAIQAHPVRALSVHGAFWVMVYAYYWSVI